MPITIDGVNLANATAPVLFQTCKFPIMDLRRYQVPDEVVMNMLAYIGRWANGTIAPAIASQVLNINTLTNIADACRFPIVSAALTSCSWIAPNQKLIGLETEQINWNELVTAYCTNANIGDPDRIGQIFNADGTLFTGNPYSLNIVRFYMDTLVQGIGLTYTHSAMMGDYANVNQFDGLYPQIDNGWEEGSIECDNALNVGNVIDWNELTGGSGVASPDAVTTSGHTVTLWGTSFSVPAGWNLGDFLAHFSSSAQSNYGRGSELEWEMHVPTGWRMAVLKALSCIELCNLSSYPVTDRLIQRYSDLIAGQVADLFGYGLTFPILETAYTGGNTIRFGPRKIGGLPTYGMVFENIVDVLRQLSPIGNALYGSGSGRPPGGGEPLLKMTRSQIANRFESLALHWDFLKISALCVRASLMLKAGVLATDRHLWLKIINVGTTTFNLAAPNDWTVDGDAMNNAPPVAPTLLLPADGSSATDTTPTYTWTAISDAVQYQIQLSTTDAVAGEFVPADIVKDELVTAATYTPPVMPVDQYFWHVRARDLDYGWGAWSVVRDNSITL